MDRDLGDDRKIIAEEKTTHKKGLTGGCRGPREWSPRGPGLGRRSGGQGEASCWECHRWEQRELRERRVPGVYLEEEVLLFRAKGPGVGEHFDFWAARMPRPICSCGLFHGIQRVALRLPFLPMWWVSVAGLSRRPPMIHLTGRQAKLLHQPCPAHSRKTGQVRNRECRACAVVGIARLAINAQENCILHCLKRQSATWRAKCKIKWVWCSVREFWVISSNHRIQLNSTPRTGAAAPFCGRTCRKRGW